MAKRETYTELDDAGLLQALADAKEALFNLRFQNATGQLDNFASIRDSRRRVARINTELRAREIAASETLDTRRENA
ncbi:MAG: 50S ribosomal protein L29 [Acidimicrobiales bacterium]